MKRDLDPNTCLAPTDFMDSAHPSIRQTVTALELDALGSRERAARLFAYIRDEIAYEFAIRLTPDEYVASYILGDGKGFCVRKAVLLGALGRAAGIPTALVLCDLRDMTLSDEVRDALGTDIMYHHGLNAFHLDGDWVLIDASLTPDLNRRKGYRGVQFDGVHDALLPDTTLAGDPHTEYVTFHGLYADLPYEQMMDAFCRGYANADVARVPKLGFGPRETGQ